MLTQMSKLLELPKETIYWFFYAPSFDFTCHYFHLIYASARIKPSL